MSSSSEDPKPPLPEPGVTSRRGAQAMIATYVQTASHAALAERLLRMRLRVTERRLASANTEAEAVRHRTRLEQQTAQHEALHGRVEQYKDRIDELPSFAAAGLTYADFLELGLGACVTEEQVKSARVRAGLQADPPPPAEADEQELEAAEERGDAATRGDDLPCSGGTAASRVIDDDDVRHATTVDPAKPATEVISETAPSGDVAQEASHPSQAGTSNVMSSVDARELQARGALPFESLDEAEARDFEAEEAVADVFEQELPIVDGDLPPVSQLRGLLQRRRAARKPSRDEEDADEVVDWIDS